MYTMRCPTLFLCLLLLCAACDSDRRRVREALRLSGDNRPELERVLHHYRNDPEKLRAARYLIANMPCHFALVGEEVGLIEEGLRRLATEPDCDSETLASWQHLRFERLEPVSDCRVIRADYLIRNIDAAFDHWRNRPWNRNLGFDEFCELLLPYRVGTAPLEEWREAYAARYAPLVDSLLGETTDVVEIVNRLGQRLIDSGRFRYDERLRHPRLRPLFLLETPVGTCLDICDYTLYMLRAVGIPAAIDYYTYQGQHAWNVLRDTTGRYVPFWLTKYTGNAAERGGGDGRRKGKVFRYCHAGRQPLPTRDVTADYFPSNCASLKTARRYNGQALRLALFDKKEWRTLDCATASGGQVRFRDVEPGVIYSVRDDGGHGVGYAFTVDTVGRTRLFIPDTTCRQRVVLKRKYLLWRYQRKRFTSVTGARIEVSDHPDFPDPQLVAILPEPETFRHHIRPELGRKYRYLRFRADSSQRLLLAELQVYDTTRSQQPLPMTVVRHSLFPPNAKRNCRPDHCLDGDILTYAWSDDRAGYITFDLGSPASIHEIVCVPWNDDNFVHPGDTYELFYHNGGDDWVSLGRQTADGYELVYDGVPVGAALWLRNLSRGREESLFTMCDGEQRFG